MLSTVLFPCPPLAMVKLHTSFTLVTLLSCVLWRVEICSQISKEQTVLHQKQMSISRNYAHPLNVYGNVYKWLHNESIYPLLCTCSHWRRHITYVTICNGRKQIWLNLCSSRGNYDMPSRITSLTNRYLLLESSNLAVLLITNMKNNLRICHLKERPFYI